jgi:hypothetical protein
MKNTVLLSVSVIELFLPKKAKKMYQANKVEINRKTREKYAKDKLFRETSS